LWLLFGESFFSHFYFQIIKTLRQYLDSRGFVEVETPILQLAAGGATAQPFETYSEALNQHLFLRIAPELFLKVWNAFFNTHIFDLIVILYD
jgi:lysyl-tRNA synthetase class II